MTSIEWMQWVRRSIGGYDQRVFKHRESRHSRRRAGQAPSCRSPPKFPRRFSTSAGVRSSRGRSTLSRHCGVKDFVVVIRLRRRRAWKMRLPRIARDKRVTIRTIFNPFFAVADNLASCWMARDEMNGDFIQVNGDNLFQGRSGEGAARCAPSAPVTVAINHKAAYDADDMKVMIGRRAVDRDRQDPAARNRRCRGDRLLCISRGRRARPMSIRLSGRCASRRAQTVVSRPRSACWPSVFRVRTRCARRHRMVRSRFPGRSAAGTSARRQAGERCAARSISSASSLSAGLSTSTAASAKGMRTGRAMRPRRREAMRESAGRDSDLPGEKAQQCHRAEGRRSAARASCAPVPDRARSRAPANERLRRQSRRDCSPRHGLRPNARNVRLRFGIARQDCFGAWRGRQRDRRPTPPTRSRKKCSISAVRSG